MKFTLAQNLLSYSLAVTLKKCGYFILPSRQSNTVSYVRRLSKVQHYPRFHLYIEIKQDQYIFNLHLDQKSASYPGQKAHSGEYDEPIVQDERERIKEILKYKL